MRSNNWLFCSSGNNFILKATTLSTIKRATRAVKTKITNRTKTSFVWCTNILLMKYTEDDIKVNPSRIPKIIVHPPVLNILLFFKSTITYCTISFSSYQICNPNSLLRQKTHLHQNHHFLFLQNCTPYQPKPRIIPHHFVHLLLFFWI